jgi:hypothetical protein
VFARSGPTQERPTPSGQPLPFLSARITNYMRRHFPKSAPITFFFKSHLWPDPIKASVTKAFCAFFCFVARQKKAALAPGAWSGSKPRGGGSAASKGAFLSVEKKSPPPTKNDLNLSGAKRAPSGGGVKMTYFCLRRPEIASVPKRHPPLPQSGLRS